jgi:hypothetical protein
LLDCGVVGLAAYGEHQTEMDRNNEVWKHVTSTPDLKTKG